MSTDWANQTKLDDAHAERREAANLSQLFQAHGSAAFARLAAHWAGVIDLEGQSSLDSCEHPSRRASTDQPSGDYPETAADLEVVTDATMAIRAGLSRSRERQRKILGMIDADEVGHAKRFARCQRQSAQLECGECGYDGNYVPITCDSRLCPVCMNRRMGSTMEEYGELVEGMASPTFATYTIENVSEVETGVDALQGAFRRLRQRTIPACGEVTREIDGEIETFRWVWKQGDDGGEPADYYWKSELCAAGKQELARTIQKRYINQGKQIPFTELVKGGLYGIDIKQQESDRYHVHLHTLMDAAYIPQAALSSVWEDLTGAPVVDVRRGDQEALRDVVGYVCKPPEFESVEAQIDYLTTLKGRQLLQPFGSLYGNTPEKAGLLRCANCDVVPLWWDYLGIVDEFYDTMTPTWEESGDRPPP